MDFEELSWLSISVGLALLAVAFPLYTERLRKVAARARARLQLQSHDTTFDLARFSMRMDGHHGRTVYHRQGHAHRKATRLAKTGRRIARLPFFDRSSGSAACSEASHTAEAETDSASHRTNWRSSCCSSVA